MDTIVALSSGQGQAGIAVVRVSGPLCRFAIETILDRTLEPRRASLVTVRDVDGDVIDRCIGLFFHGPSSATGEDILELHLHGSRAVVQATLDRLVQLDRRIRLAEPGEFTRRALENGKMDLLEVEALGELLAAETPKQLRQAQRQLAGDLARQIEGWRQEILECRALIEAELDFSDEGDVGEGLLPEAQQRVEAVGVAIEAVLAGAERGFRVREGAVIVIAGPPNVGKSSLMNALARRDLAIVSDIAGTTRDLIEAPAVFDGWPAVLIDTAGLRDTDDPIERQGVERARGRVREADLVLSLFCQGLDEATVPGGPSSVLRINSKADLDIVDSDAIVLSTKTGLGLDLLRECIALALSRKLEGEPPLISRTRQRDVLIEARQAIQRACGTDQGELAAEELRAATNALDRLVGRTNVDSVLDALFAGFCIGK